ncbi:MAG TPA: ABC transporter ATP-binding protein [Ktedonobacteraceae bacterium]|nr:ABC transporter ATP-binding protein [Ktedonobacteraceae bacterium]
MQEHMVHCANLIRIYKVADLEAIALQGLDLEVARGEMIALVGASGSGKTTLLNILGGLDAPTAGQVRVADFDLTRLSEEQRTRYRNLVTGYVWQQSGRNLLPDLTIEGNVNLPQLLNGVGAARSSKRTYELLELVGLPTMAKKKPAQLSGGEQQRVAIAIALANQPALLLADEPTGELDSVTAQEIIACLRQINTQLGLTIILVTHDVSVASEVDRTLAIRDGRTSTETVRRGTPPATQEARHETVATNGASAVIGLSLQTHRESILVDAAGRMQLPREALERLVINGRLEAFMLDDHIELWPTTVKDDGQIHRVTSLQQGASRKDELA